MEACRQGDLRKPRPKHPGGQSLGVYNDGLSWWTRIQSSTSWASQQYSEESILGPILQMGKPRARSALVAPRERIHLPMQEMQVRSQGCKDLLEKEMATHSNILAWGNPLNRGAWQATVHGAAKESDTT